MWKRYVLSFTLSLLLATVCSKFTKSNKAISKTLKTELQGNRSAGALGRHVGGGIAFRSHGWNPLKPTNNQANDKIQTEGEVAGEDACVGACGAYQDCYLDDITPLCICKPGYSGHPFTGCVYNSDGGRCSSDFDCPSYKACLNNICSNPCEGACSVNTECVVTNHRATCACNSATAWNPSFGCVPKPTPTCSSDGQCPADRACLNRRCTDPCIGLCGKNTVCHVKNHHPACACKPGFHGNAFQECKSSGQEDQEATIVIEDESSKPVIDRRTNRLKGKKKFSLINRMKNWVEALAHCRSLNMDLAAIESNDDEAKLESILKNENPNKSFWTSGTDLGNMNVYMWATTGSSVDFEVLRNYVPSANTKKIVTCIEVRTGRVRPQWRSFSCRSKQAFLCEYYVKA